MTVDGDGEHYKRTESGELIPFINKDKMKQSFEYLFDFGISLKDLQWGKIISMETDSITDIEKFVDDYYLLTDEGYCPNFNESHGNPMQLLRGIIDKRKNHEELSEEERDFAYDCYPSNMSNGDEGKYYLDENIADRLLFGGSPGVSSLLSMEATRLNNDDSKKYLSRIGFVVKQSQEMRGGFEEGRGDSMARANYEQACAQIKSSVWKNLPAFYEHIDGMCETYAREYEPHEDEGMSDDATELLFSIGSMGRILLNNCEFGSGGMHPVAWKGENSYKNSDKGIGDIMIKCGISLDEILDTYFGGPEQSFSANYKPTYQYLEARRIPELLKIGIPKKDIIENIRKKNVDGINVRISDEEIRIMRQAGVDNIDILDAMQDKLVHHPEDTKEKFNARGFTDDDIIGYLARELRRSEEE